MKQKNKLLGAIAFLFLGTTSFAQVTQLNNFSPIFPPNPFLGWNGTGFSRPLEIRNDFNEPIEMYTNGIQRMLINNGLGLVNNGRIAMGNNLPSGFTPRSRLHLHNTSGQTRIQFTNNNTSGGGSPTGLSGFQVGINAGGHGIIRQREQQTIRFFTGNQEIMRLTPPDNSGFNDMVTI